MALDTPLAPAADFMRQFMKDIIHNPLDRQQILEKGTADLEARQGLIEDKIAEWYADGVPKGFTAEEWLIAYRANK